MTSDATTAERSRNEIRELVQKRVQERESWTVDGIQGEKHASRKEAFHFLAKVLPKYLKFNPMSQQELDKHFPVLSLDWKKLQNPPANEIQITWLGHSSLLVQMNGSNLVMDPVFSERCSASQWFGPKRYRQPPCTVEKLCSKLSIDAILISHNHYDHLDYISVKDFCKYSSALFVVPLGLRVWFRRHVSKDVNVHELDWHERVDLSEIGITSVPMRHWSNRVGDRDKTLWCGYSVVTPNKRFLFPGDTAWFDELSEIGKQYGPFDLAAIPIGAYEPRDFMKYNHINVEEAVRMKEAVQAKAAVPIHWGTFPLTVEPVLEPREKLTELMKEKPDAETFAPWFIGETKIFWRDKHCSGSPPTWTNKTTSTLFTSIRKRSYYLVGSLVTTRRDQPAKRSEGGRRADSAKWCASGLDSSSNHTTSLMVWTGFPETREL